MDELPDGYDDGDLEAKEWLDPVYGYNMKYILAAKKDLLDQDIDWPDARQLEVEAFADKVSDLINEISGCRCRYTVEQIAVKIWRALRGE